MRKLRFTLQILSVVVAIAAAGLWWWASIMKPETVTSLSGIVSGDGDLAFQFAPSKILVWRVSLQATLNAWAAICTGLSVLLQAGAGLLPD